MASTTTLTTLVDVINTINDTTDAKNYARIVNIVRLLPVTLDQPLTSLDILQRNMAEFERVKDNNAVVPVRRTTTNPSPVKQSASNRPPGQTHGRTEMDGALDNELPVAQCLMQDLADHVFGHIVSTELARDILQNFVEDNIVQVFDGEPEPHNTNLIDPKSDEARNAVRQAFEYAKKHTCRQPGAQSDVGESESSSADMKGKGVKEKSYKFRWTRFPAQPLCQDDVVGFLNNITDHAFAFAKPKLAVANPGLRHRFAAPADKHYAVPLSYEPDGEDMRPDFLLLPIEAFSEDFKTIDSKYVNLTASRLVGESKNSDLAQGVDQMQRYIRGLRWAQPWVYYVLGLTITKDSAMFLRGEGSGTERLKLVLTDGRGCIEFIRILLGLSLADKVDLGHNPRVELEGEKRICKARNVTRRSNATTAKPRLRREGVFSTPNPASRRLPEAESGSHRRSDPTANASRGPVNPLSSTKRVHSEMAGAEREVRSKRRNIGQSDIEDVERFVFLPIAVYGHRCLGILFTAGSICGRGTTVFCVVDLQDENKRLALKMAWQDLTRMADQDAVMKRLADHGPQGHPNLVVPLEYVLHSF